ncbi:hypothetical protein JW968_03715 [Candidatus Woesearchaeota archaeon]|nr:hypothetical protein [Candidatus Woesearchaeota archaeon]
MKIQVESEQKRKIFLRPDMILKYLITENDELNTLIMCGNAEIDFRMSDQGLYEALGSIKEYDGFRHPKLTKLLEVAEIMPFSKMAGQPRHILTEDKVEELRAKALKEGE